MTLRLSLSRSRAGWGALRRSGCRSTSLSCLGWRGLRTEPYLIKPWPPDTSCFQESDTAWACGLGRQTRQQPRAWHTQGPIPQPSTGNKRKKQRNSRWLLLRTGAGFQACPAPDAALSPVWGCSVLWLRHTKPRRGQGSHRRSKPGASQLQRDRNPGWLLRDRVTVQVPSALWDKEDSAALTPVTTHCMHSP